MGSFRAEIGLISLQWLQ